MNYQYIKTEQSDLIATIRFNHYSKRNALSECLIEEMHHALEVFGKEDVRVLVLRSDKKNKVWSAGHDVMELPRSERDPLPADDPVMVNTAEYLFTNLYDPESVSYTHLTLPTKRIV